jgi:ketosteroid isomerase-like protein
MNREIDSAREQIDAAWLRSDADGITRHLAEDAVLLVGRKSIHGLEDCFSTTP